MGEGGWANSARKPPLTVWLMSRVVVEWPTGFSLPILHSQLDSVCGGST